MRRNVLDGVVLREEGTYLLSHPFDVGEDTIFDTMVAMVHENFKDCHRSNGDKSSACLLVLLLRPFSRCTCVLNKLVRDVLHVLAAASGLIKIYGPCQYSKSVSLEFMPVRNIIRHSQGQLVLLLEEIGHVAD